MTFSSEKLLNELDRNPDQIPRFWATELKNGKDAYAFLTKAIRSSELNVDQMRNALHALFRIRGHGSSSDVLEIFVELASHPNREIRSEAVQLAIGLVRFINDAEKIQMRLSDKQEESLRAAVAVGLTPKVAELAANFLKG